MYISHLLVLLQGRGVPSGLATGQLFYEYEVETSWVQGILSGLDRLNPQMQP
jgi:hypothetical protein